jgi:hypothetical protein
MKWSAGGGSEGNRALESVGLGGRIILNRILDELIERFWSGLIWLR